MASYNVTSSSVRLEAGLNGDIRARVQELVGVGVADARDRALVAQHALDLRATGLVEDALEDLDRERVVERVGSQARDAGHLLGSRTT